MPLEKRNRRTGCEGGEEQSDLTWSGRPGLVVRADVCEEETVTLILDGHIRLTRAMTWVGKEGRVLGRSNSVPKGPKMRWHHPPEELRVVPKSWSVVGESDVWQRDRASSAWWPRGGFQSNKKTLKRFREQLLQYTHFVECTEVAAL